MGERVKSKDKPSEIKLEKSVSNSRETDFSQFYRSSDESALFLQGMVGNQGVQRLFTDGVIQAKLRIGQPGDKYEQEADRVADMVMRMPEPQAHNETTISTLTQVPYIQRQCSACENEMIRQELEDEGVLQRKEINNSISQTPSNFETQMSTIQGTGKPLPESVRNFFEPRFGYDFSQVRVHSDVKAAESAREINAQAFTMGRDIVFGSGQFALNTKERQQLLAHELMHVIQQQAPYGVITLTPRQAETQVDFVTNRLDRGFPVNQLGRVPVETIQMQQRSGINRTISPEREAQLQNLARFPFNFAGLPGRPTWQDLTEDERSIVILAMDGFYGREFTNQFVRFAEAEQLRLQFFGTSLRTTRTRGTLNPIELLRAGWRLAIRRLPVAGRIRPTEEWVHPSGGYILIGPAQEADEVLVQRAIDEARRLQQSGNTSQALEVLERERSIVEHMELQAVIQAGLTPQVTDPDRVIDIIIRFRIVLPPEVVEWRVLNNELRGEGRRPLTDEEIMEELLEEI
jgi:hypothetical protein